MGSLDKVGRIRVVLIVCINVSNLLLARAMSRGKEFAMRTALGAGRGRLVRQLLTESFTLSGAGAALGLAFAWALTFYLARQSQMALPLLTKVRVDGAALSWTVLIAVSVGAIFGLAPALKVSGGNLQESLKDGGLGMSQGRRQERLRSTLVVCEVALACVLLIGAGLLLRSFLRLLDVDLGFEPSAPADCSPHSATASARSACPRTAASTTWRNETRSHACASPAPSSPGSRISASPAASSRRSTS